MLGEDGQPKKHIFVADMLHMNGAGYDIWRDTVRPVLVAAETEFEAGKAAVADEPPTIGDGD